MNRFTAILTNFSGHNRNVVLGYTLPVQKLVGRDGSSDRIDVEEAVQVTLPIDGIPKKEHTGEIFRCQTRDARY